MNLQMEEYLKLNCFEKTEAGRKKKLKNKISHKTWKNE